MQDPRGGALFLGKAVVSDGNVSVSLISRLGNREFLSLDSQDFGCFQLTPRRHFCHLALASRWPFPACSPAQRCPPPRLSVPPGLCNIAYLRDRASVLVTPLFHVQNQEWKIDFNMRIVRKGSLPSLSFNFPGLHYSKPHLGLAASREKKEWHIIASC